jgi:hypothetical protein
MLRMKQNHINAIPVFANGSNRGTDALITHGETHDLSHARLK